METSISADRAQAQRDEEYETRDSAFDKELSLLRPAYRQKDGRSQLKARLEYDLSALCLSGGGIRSASFALGCIQQLAARKKMEKFDYLSTVSGGGYIGTALIAWLKRAQENEPVSFSQEWVRFGDLAHRHYMDSPEVANMPRDPVEWMRAHSNYLARRFSIFSADTFAVVATYIRNLVINWVVFLPWIALFFGLPWLIIAITTTSIQTASAMLLIPAIAYFIFLCIAKYHLAANGQVGKLDNNLFWLSAVPIFAAAAIAAAVLTLLNPGDWDWLNIDILKEQKLGLVLVIAFGPSVVLLLGCVIFSIFRAMFVSQSADLEREQEARYYALLLIAAVAWTVCATSSLLWPPLLNTLEGPARAATLTASGTTLSLSTYFGYRASTPGAPGAKPALSMTLLGTVGIVLLALALGWGSWHAIGLLTKFHGQRSAEANCACLDQTSGSSIPVDGNVNAHVSGRLNVIGCACPAPSSDIFRLPIGKDVHRLWYVILGVLLFGTFSFLLGFTRFDLNNYSLHGFYRNRLLLAFHAAFRQPSPADRTPDSFTGFDPNDDLRMADLASLYRDTTAPEKRNEVPFLVINTALNLVKGENLAWQERKADSFTFTALHAGNYRLGYRPVKKFGGGVKVSTAMAISGAAFNPNMGYNSSVPMGFLMSLFNVRLGWWLGNPVRSMWKSAGPTNAPWTMLMEACGKTTDSGDWVHLSDGGHFDNLGLWEMVHRRCRKIVIIDASCDRDCTLEDLANAIRKIRVDQGISIVSNGPVHLFSRAARSRGSYFARYTINYGDADPTAAAHKGEILYIKALLYGTEPPEVLEYAEKHQDFPHQPTTDQFFTESQFESYRRLGEHEMKTILDEIGTEVPLPKESDVMAEFLTR